MRYGFFDDEKREYVINRPDTPYPWINYLGQENFFTLISHLGGGYSFYRDAKLLRLTRYRYNNVPTDAGGQYFYINESGDLWTHTWMPVKANLDEYWCRHGLGYTMIHGKRNGLSVTQTSLVPLGADAEVTRLVLENDTDTDKNFTLFSFVEFCLYDALDDMTNFQRNYSTGQVEVEGSTIYHKTEYRERRRHYAFYEVNAPIDGFDTDRESFFGLYNGFDEPNVPRNGRSNDSIALGWSPIASHMLRMHLAPRQKRSLIFVLGFVELEKDRKWEGENVINKEPVKALFGRFQTDKQFDGALSSLKTYYDSLLSHFQVKSPDDMLDREVDIWNQYQCMVTYRMSRSASYFESGIGRGMGFRDSSQDLLGFVHIIPTLARVRILDIAATQKEDGSAYHQYQPLTKRGNNAIGSGFNDDPLWLLYGTVAYVKETGDFSILSEMVPYDNDDDKAKPLFDHLLRSYHHVTNNLGPHGLPLIGRADWNDCLNLNCFSEEPGEPFQTTANFESGKAESLFIAGLFVLVSDDYRFLCGKIGLNDEASFVAKASESMRRAILEHGWDGQWFLRAYDAFGGKVGSHENEDGKIYIESQGICVMAGIGVESGYAEQAMKSVAKHLETPWGISLLDPPYKDYHKELGEVSSYPPSYKENGGVFCHNNPWIIIAEAMLGHGNHAYEVYRKITPGYWENQSEVHRLEPYAYAQMVASTYAKKPGEAKNSWLTGTSSWALYAVSQYILGIRPEFNGLVVDPCIPKYWKGFEATRTWRGATYHIVVENPDGAEKGISRVTLDGKECGRTLPVLGDGKRHEVMVRMHQS